MTDPTSRIAKIQPRLDDQDAMSPTVSEDDIAWLLNIAQLSLAHVNGMKEATFDALRDALDAN